MPPTTENIPEKPPFDVYAMMLILSTLLTLGACLLINDDLSKNWNFWVDKTDKAALDKATHITQITDDPAKDVGLKIQKVDLEEWAKIKGKGSKFPITDYEWPAGYDPAKSPVRGDTDNLQIPEAERKALLEGGGKVEAPAPAPAPAPATPPADGAAPAPAPAPAPDATPKAN
jgi:hypothetical protein